VYGLHSALGPESRSSGPKFEPMTTKENAIHLNLELLVGKASLQCSKTTTTFRVLFGSSFIELLHFTFKSSQFVNSYVRLKGRYLISSIRFGWNLQENP